MIHWDNFPGSTVPIKALCVSSLFNCAPSGAKQRLAGTIFPFRHRYKGPNERLNVSLGHKDAPLPTLCLPYITAP